MITYATPEAVDAAVWAEISECPERGRRAILTWSVRACCIATRVNREYAIGWLPSLWAWFTTFLAPFEFAWVWSRAFALIGAKQYRARYHIGPRWTLLPSCSRELTQVEAVCRQMRRQDVLWYLRTSETSMAERILLRDAIGLCDHPSRLN